jgi:hypothetical protein
MPFDWNNYLTLAEELGNRLDEAAQRTAISRAYYCVFNLALARAGPPPVAQGIHAWCWAKYEEHPDPSCRLLGINGKRMKARRERADYNPADFRRWGDEVGLMLEEARQFQTALQALPIRFPLP